MTKKRPVLSDKEVVAVKKWLDVHETMKPYTCPFIKDTMFACQQMRPNNPICTGWFPRTLWHNSEDCPCKCYTQTHVIKTAKRMVKGR
jgi:hypothetical protein